MMRPEQSEQSRFEQIQMSKRSIDDGHLLPPTNFQGVQNNNASTIENSIYVEMPAGISAKNSARTNYNFYKNATGTKTQVKGGGFNGGIQSVEESPQRQSNDTLPNLNIKVNTI